MKELTTPRSRIIQHGGDMLKILAIHKDKGYDKTKLGHLVKYYGGDKLLKNQETLFICEIIKDAEIVSE